MARYGQTLLRTLTLQYCDRMGCSVGMREYIESVLPSFKQRHPDVEVVTVKRRNQFPLVKAEYSRLPHNADHLERKLMRQQLEQQQQSAQQPSAGQQQQQAPQQQHRSQVKQLSQHSSKQSAPPRMNSNVIGMKSRSAAEIREVVWWLTQSQCRPRTSRIPARHMVSKHRSIQGPWNATTF